MIRRKLAQPSLPFPVAKPRMVRRSKPDPKKVRAFLIKFRFSYIERWGIPQTDAEQEKLRRLRFKFSKHNDLSDEDIAVLEKLTYKGDVTCRKPAYVALGKGPV
jgi:hypothetical protein